MDTPLHFPRAPQHQVALSCTALTFTVGMLNVPAEENRVEQLPHIEVAPTERTMKLSYYKDFHGDPHAGVIALRTCSGSWAIRDAVIAL